MNLIQDQEDRRGLEVGGAAWRHGTKKVVKLLFTSAQPILNRLTGSGMPVKIMLQDGGIMA